MPTPRMTTNQRSTFIRKEAAPTVPAIQVSAPRDHIALAPRESDMPDTNACQRVLEEIRWDEV